MPERRHAAALLALALASPAAAEELVVVTQPEIAQYADVLAGLREVHAAVAALDAKDEAAVKTALGRGPGVVVAIGSKAATLVRGAGPRAVVGAAVLGGAPAPGWAAVPLETRAADALGALAVLAPRVKRVAALYPADAAAAEADARAAAKAAGLEVTFTPLADLSDFQGTFRHAADGADAVWLLTDPRLARPELVKFMITHCLERRIPLVGFLDGMTRTGALLSVSADFKAIGREAARLAADLEAKPPAGPGPFRFAPGRLSVNERVRDMLQLGGRVPAGAETFR